MREMFRDGANEASLRLELPTVVTAYDIIGLVGEGATARVYLCEPKEKPEEADPEAVYGMKVMCKADVVARGKQDDVARERELLQAAAGHPFVLNAHACFESRNFEYLILEYCSGGDLFGVQTLQFPGSRMPEDAARFYFVEVMLGCECIHDLGFVIRDLKPENVLIHQDGHCRVSDFDLSIQADRPAGREQLVGTAEYLSPEILETVEREDGKETCCASSVTKACDVWVLGIMLFEMLHGYSPFSRRGNETLQESRERIKRSDSSNTSWQNNIGRVRVKRTASVKGSKSMRRTGSKLSKQTSASTTKMISVSDAARQMMKLCLASDHTKRPTVIALRDQKFVSKIDWRTATARKLKPPWVPHEVTQEQHELLRQQSKEERSRRGSTERPGWEGHSIAGDMGDDDPPAPSPEVTPKPDEAPPEPKKITRIESMDDEQKQMIRMYAMRLRRENRPARPTYSHPRPVPLVPFGNSAAPLQRGIALAGAAGALAFARVLCGLCAGVTAAPLEPAMSCARAPFRRSMGRCVRANTHAAAASRRGDQKPARGRREGQGFCRRREASRPFLRRSGQREGDGGQRVRQHYSAGTGRRRGGEVRSPPAVPRSIPCKRASSQPVNDAGPLPAGGHGGRVRRGGGGGGGAGGGGGGRRCGGGCGGSREGRGAERAGCR